MLESPSFQRKQTNKKKAGSRSNWICSDDDDDGGWWRLFYGWVWPSHAELTVPLYCAAAPTVQALCLTCTGWYAGPGTDYSAFWRPARASSTLQQLLLWYEGPRVADCLSLSHRLCCSGICLAVTTFFLILGISSRSLSLHASLALWRCREKTQSCSLCSFFFYHFIPFRVAKKVRANRKIIQR